MSNPRADHTVEIVGDPDQADYKVQVVGDQVVDLTGAQPGDVLVVQADGTLAPAAPSGGGGAVDSVTAASGKIVVGGTASDPTVDVGTGIPESAVTGLVADLGAKVATAGHTSNSVPAASGSTSLADLAMGASTILARLAAGNIVAATPAELKTLLAIAQGDVTGLVAALALKAPLADPTFTGVATAPSLTASGKTGATATPVTLAGGTASGAPSTGAHVKGELVADDTGALWYCTVAGTPGTWVQIVAAGTLLNVVKYHPASPVVATTTSGTFADLDATNLVIPFTVPPTGKVLVRVTCTAVCALNSRLSWSLREGASNVAGTEVEASGNGQSRVAADILVTGLTPGDAKSYKWGHARTAGSGSTSTIYGGSTAEFGQALMTVWAAP